MTRIALGRFSGLRPACAALRRPKRWRVLSNGVLIPAHFPQANKKGPEGPFLFAGGERGIRTLGTVSPYTRFPGEHLKPLSHLSEFCLPGLLELPLVVLVFAAEQNARWQVKTGLSGRAFWPRGRFRQRHFLEWIEAVQAFRHVDAAAFDGQLIRANLVAGFVDLAACAAAGHYERRAQCGYCLQYCLACHANPSFVTPARAIAWRIWS